MRLQEFHKSNKTKILKEGFNHAIHIFDATSLHLNDLYDMLENTGFYDVTPSFKAGIPACKYGGFETILKEKRHWYWIINEDNTLGGWMMGKLYIFIKDNGKLCAEFITEEAPDDEMNLTMDQAETFLARQHVEIK